MYDPHNQDSSISKIIMRIILLIGCLAVILVSCNTLKDISEESKNNSYLSNIQIINEDGEVVNSYEGKIKKIYNSSGFFSSPDMSVYQFELDGEKYRIKLAEGDTIKETKYY
jgi:hypothetical protein